MGVLKGICVSMKYMALGKSRQQGFWIMNCIAEFSKQKVKKKFETRKIVSMFIWT